MARFLLLLMLVCQCLMAPGRSPASIAPAVALPGATLSLSAQEDQSVLADAEDGDDSDDQDQLAGHDDTAILHDPFHLAFERPRYGEASVSNVVSAALSIELPPPERA